MLVSLSTMPAGEKYLEYAKEVETFCDFLHIDVCDGIYNSTKCFLPEYAKKINDNSTIPMDCHLMTKNSLYYAKKYIKCGVNIVTAQIESFQNEQEILDFVEYVKSHNALCGLALEPGTKIDVVLPYISKIDIVLVMSVQTGKSGQDFDESVLSKIEYFKKMKSKLNFKIEVDGGINEKTAKLVKDAGADIVVSGNYVYNSNDYQESIDKIRC